MRVTSDSDWKTGEELLGTVPLKQQTEVPPPLHLTEGDRSMSGKRHAYNNSSQIARQEGSPITDRQWENNDRLKSIPSSNNPTIVAGGGENSPVNTFLHHKELLPSHLHPPPPSKGGGKLKISIVARFITKLKKYSSYLRFQQASKRQLEIINDSSFNFAYFYSKGSFVSEVNHPPPPPTPF